MEDSKGDLARIVTKAEAKRLVKSDAGAVVGVEFQKDGKMHVEYGPVIIATGGFGADYQPDSLLAKHRPELRALPTPTATTAQATGSRWPSARARARLT